VSTDDPSADNVVGRPCHKCGRGAPPGRYCVFCGAVLEPAGDERGGHFAAAPHEHCLVPHAVSTLFPHLPRAGHVVFRGLLATGIALVASLALAGLFPIGLIAAAVIVPLLFVVYFREVDLYEDEPLLVLAGTIVWGAASGVAVGLLSNAVQSSGAALQSPTTGHSLLWNGVLIPLIGLVVVLAGPLALLPYRKFNDALDGVTFAGAAAVVFAGAELLTGSTSFLSGGVAPLGQVAPWTLRLLTLGFAVPVLVGSALGAVGGSFWVRFRAPEGKRRRLGVLGTPLASVALAATLLVGAALLALALDRWAALAALVGLDLVALLRLRLLIHVGLLEEDEEVLDAPPVRCANCGRTAPAQRFCAYCGVARRALPKRHGVGGQRVPWPLIGRFGIGLALLTGIGTAAALAAAPGAVRPVCPVRTGCAVPPSTIGVGPPGTRRAQSRIWRSARGVRLTYDPTHWQTLASTPTRLDIEFAHELELTVQTTVSGPGDQESVANELGALSSRYPDLEPDLAHEPPAAEIGGIVGVGELLAGHDLDGQPVEVLVEASTLGDVTAVVTAWTSQQAHTSQQGVTTPFDILVNADVVLETFLWAAPGSAQG
jgi:hypothetical protein